jgi:hypothetical protein
MDWSDWIVFGLGIALGSGGSWWWSRRRTRPDEPSAQESAPGDRAELERLSRQLEQARLDYQMVAQMCQFKSGFLARVSHELRSPLNGLIGTHQLILSDLCEDPAEEREFLSKANERSQQLVKMIDEILNVARTEYGKNPLQLDPVPMAEVFDEVYRLTHLQVANRNYRLAIEDPDPSLWVNTDFRRLKQVLVNLIENAIDQMEEGTIALSAQSDSQQDYVAIRLDTPCPIGVWSEPIDLMQAKENMPSDRLSPGLNLILDQMLLEVMGGRLELQEHQGNGRASQILCLVPQALPEAQAESQSVGY